MRIQLAEAAVKACLEQADDQHQALVALYRLVFPEWDQIERLQGWPAVNEVTWTAIARLFIAFDEAHHPSVLPGGCWMNGGFSSAPGLADWEVSLDNCTVWPDIRYTTVEAAVSVQDDEARIKRRVTEAAQPGGPR